jgi:hypothetical protein
MDVDAMVANAMVANAMAANAIDVDVKAFCTQV